MIRGFLDWLIGLFDGDPTCDPEPGPGIISDDRGEPERHHAVAWPRPAGSRVAWVGPPGQEEPYLCMPWETPEGVERHYRAHPELL